MLKKFTLLGALLVVTIFTSVKPAHAFIGWINYMRYCGALYDYCNNGSENDSATVAACVAFINNCSAN